MVAILEGNYQPRWSFRVNCVPTKVVDVDRVALNLEEQLIILHIDDLNEILALQVVLDSKVLVHLEQVVALLYHTNF